MPPPKNHGARLRDAIWNKLSGPLCSPSPADGLAAAGKQSRVVNVSSLAHRTTLIDFDDLQGARIYSPWKAYGQSKLAMLMFALELQRRSDAVGWNVTSAHPVRPHGPLRQWSR